MSISEFGLLIADEDGYESWRQRQLELEEQYEEQMMYEELTVPAANREEEMLDRRERAAAVNSVGKRYY